MWLAGGALAGVAATATRAAASFWFAEFGVRELIELRWMWLYDGVAAGACTGTAAALVTLNAAASLSFLLFVARAPSSQFDEIAQRRATEGAGTMMATDLLTILAARPFGGWRPLPLPGRWLVLMAHAAIFLCQTQVVPIRYVGTDPTRGESYVVAALAPVVSSRWWVIVGRRQPRHPGTMATLFGPGGCGTIRASG